MSNGGTKVLIFSTAYFPFVGGAEVAVKEITDRINDMKFDMITAKMDRKLPAFERIGNVNIYRMGFGWGAIDKIILAKFGVFKALKLDKKNNYDCAWSIMASQASIAAAFFKIYNKKVKLVLTLQEGDEEEHLARYVLNIKFLYKILIRPWHLLIFKKADRVTAISRHLKERAIRNGVKAPVEVIPNGVNLENYELRIKNYELDELKKLLGIKEGEKVLITTSRLVKKNGIDDLIKAAAILIKNYKLKIKLLILGGGELKDELISLSENLGIKNDVGFRGVIFPDKLPEYYKISDCFCRPSVSEGLGNSFLEAMYFGIPIIATPVGGIPDFLVNGETGWFCKVKNPQSIAEKVKYILDKKNKEEIARVVENARRMVEEKYNWETIAEKIEEVFQYV